MKEAYRERGKRGKSGGPNIMRKSDLQHSLREIRTLLTQAMANHDKNRGAIDELIDQAEEKLSALEDEVAEDDEME